MNIAEQDRRPFLPCACPTSIAPASSTFVEEGGRTRVNEIGVIGGIRKIVLPASRAASVGLGIGWIFAPGEKPGESDNWIEITPPSRAIALALTGNGVAAAPASQKPRCLDGELKGVGLFLNCEDFQRTYRNLSERGVRFLAPPARMPQGLFSVFEDIEGRRYLLGQW
jgi:hypothetical protein